MKGTLHTAAAAGATAAPGAGRSGFAVARCSVRCIAQHKALQGWRDRRHSMLLNPLTTRTTVQCRCEAQAKTGGGGCRAQGTSKHVNPTHHRRAAAGRSGVAVVGDGWEGVGSVSRDGWEVGEGTRMGMGAGAQGRTAQPGWVACCESPEACVSKLRCSRHSREPQGESRAPRRRLEAR